MDIEDKIVSIISKLIEIIFDWILEPFLGISSLQQLVFGKNDDGKLIWNTFTELELVNGLGPMYNSLLALSLVILVGILVNTGVNTARYRLTPQGRTELTQSILMLFLIGFLLRYLPALYDLLFTINGIFVDFFASSYDETKDKIIPDMVDSLIEEAVGQILIELVLVGLAIWANFYYMMRRITLLILMALGPIFLVMMVNPRWTSVTANWFKELCSTIFIQSIHALTFWFLAKISQSQTTIVGMVLSYIVFIPVTVAVRNLFPFLGGQMADNVSKAGAAFGLSSLGGVIGSVKGAMDGKSLKDIALDTLNYSRGKLNQHKNPNATATANGDVKDTLAGNAGSDIGSTKKDERMLRNGEILDRIGKGTLGAMGAITGSGLGAKGSAILGGIGYLAGGTGGGLTGRMATALGEKAKDKLKQANSLLNGGMSEQDLINSDFDVAADALAEKEASEWAEQHGPDYKENLRNQFPDASEKELDNMVAAEKARKKSQFKQRMGEQLQSAMDYGNEHLETEGLVRQSAQQLAQTWAKDNQASFNEQYAKENPQQPGESDEDFSKRRDIAFQGKTKEMERLFTNMADTAVKDSINEFGHVNKTSFATNLADKIKDIEGINNPDAMAMDAADKGKTVTLLNANGRLNKENLVNALANNATLQDKEAFIAGQEARGVSRADAIKDWNQNHASATLTKHQQYFGDEQFSNNLEKGLIKNTEVFNRAQNSVPGIRDKMHALGTVMTLDAVDTIGKHSTAIKQGVGAVQSSILTSASTGEGLFKTVKNAAVSGFDAVQTTYAQQGIEAAGSAIEAQANFQNSMGYLGGVLLGQKGVVAAKKLGMKISPYKQQVDAESYSPTEVMQMAQTTIDDGGNVQIASGAIRQVVTQDASYIEVLTRTGERKRVSRIAAGDSGLSSDAIVYQDLEVKDNTLISSTPTYHLDNAGAKVPSDVKISQNPNTLLKQGNIQKLTLPSSIPTNTISIENSSVYSPNDVQQLALSTIGENGESKIVRGAVRQVMTQSGSYIEVLSHDGKKHRVTPMGKGNSALSEDEILYQDLDIQDGKYVPITSNVGNTKSSTYVMNNGGKQATQHKIMQNPNDLFKNHKIQMPSISFPKGKDYPAFSQFVESGQFYTDDLNSQGFQNINVVVENERRFVTAEKDGVRYRVSPVYAGDTRMSSNEVREIPMTIVEGKLVPQVSSTNNSANGKVYNLNEQNKVVVTEDSYYSSKAFHNLLVSRTLISANRSVENRKLLNQARVKQGILD